MLAFPQNVLAYPTYEHDWEWNYNGAAYFYNVSLSSSYLTAAKNAASNWYKTGYHTNPLYQMTQTTIQSNSPIDLYKNSLDGAVCGQTFFFKSGGARVDNGEDEPFEDWLYCNIEIDENYVNNYFGSNNSTIKKVLLLHEMGHVFGLAHTTSTATIMYPYLDAITVTKVTYADSAALVEKLDF